MPNKKPLKAQTARTVNTPANVNVTRYSAVVCVGQLVPGSWFTKESAAIQMQADEAAVLYMVLNDSQLLEGQPAHLVPVVNMNGVLYMFSADERAIPLHVEVQVHPLTEAEIGL